MAAFVVVGLVALATWCLGGFVVACVLGRAFARGSRPESLTLHARLAGSTLPDATWLVRPAKPADDHVRAADVSRFLSR